jgi:phosphatidylserine/phosphatidylglycerophosphate/cardiolipin synthase-like enzyme
MKNAVAFANNDVATIAWSYGKRPDGCMGFAVYRIDEEGKETPLPAFAVFKNTKKQNGQSKNRTTEQFPVQKFYWKDPYARLVGEKTKSYKFRYKIVPLQGKPGSLTEMTSFPILITNEVELTSKCSESLSATFNRGLISTQHVSKALGYKANKQALLDKIEDENSQLRKDLTGQTLGTLLAFVARAKGSDQIYAALYELTDTELIDALVSLGKRLNIVLADIAEKPAGSDDSSKGAKKKAPEGPENDPAWNKLKDSAQTALYRRPPSSHIVHNKFLIYVKGNKPVAVLTGSTNWTATGLCAQTNNVLVIDDADVAQRYMDYWNSLKADEQAHQANGGDSKSFQAAAMRTFDGKSKDFTLDKNSQNGDPATPSTLTSYFSPNTPKPRPKKKDGEAEPIDMNDLETRIKGAKHAVLFLAFIPGTPSVVDFASEAQRANKDLFVRGCVTSPDAAGEFYYTLRGSSPPKRVRVPKGQPKPPKVPIKQDPRVIAAEALTKSDAPTGWAAELLKAGFAITHDKIVVIDPFAENCVVVTGSHNLGYQASYNNDENLVIVEGNKKLAQAYATHVLDVYDHFAWRWTLQRDDKPNPDAFLKETPDEWLDWYFDAQGNIKAAQLKFWMQASV